MKRFSALEKKKGVLEEVKKKETWDEAKGVLNRLSNELEKILGNDILELCNYNVCDAVQLFASILGNRQWTQKNEKAQASFKIEEYQYYLSPASCYKAIAMKNSVVFTNLYQLANIFYNNDKIGYCFPIYILLMMNESGNCNKELTLKQIQDNIVRVMKYELNLEKEKREQIEEIIQYFVERDIMFEKIIVVGEKEVICKYYISPKGKVILRNFFDSTILLEIYRDDIFLDDRVHNTNCSFNLSREDLFMDIIKIIDEIGKEEKGFLRTFENQKTLEEYYRLWRNERISIRLISALKKSLDKYYKQDLPPTLLKCVSNLESKYREELDSNI